MGGRGASGVGGDDVTLLCFDGEGEGSSLGGNSSEVHSSCLRNVKILNHYRNNNSEVHYSQKKNNDPTLKYTTLT